jgi:transcriptional regulator GlxA family with amidase domain
VTEKFVEIALSNPAKTVEEIAKELSLSRRQLERITLFVTGLPPRRLVRREQ